MEIEVEQEENTDSFILFKHKIEEAITFLPHIPPERRLEAWLLWEKITITVKLSIFLEETMVTDQAQQTELPELSCKACIRKRKTANRVKKGKKMRSTKQVTFYNESDEAVSSIILPEQQNTTENPFVLFENSALMEYTIPDSSPSILLDAAAALGDVVGNGCIVESVVSLDNPTGELETPQTSLLKQELQQMKMITIMPNENVEANSIISEQIEGSGGESPKRGIQNYDEVSLNSGNVDTCLFHVDNDNDTTLDAKMYSPGQTILITESGIVKRKSPRKNSRNKENVETVKLENESIEDQNMEDNIINESEPSQMRKAVRRSVRKNRRRRIHDYCNIDSDGEITEDLEDVESKVFHDVVFRIPKRRSKSCKKQPLELGDLTCDVCGLVLSNIGALNVHIRKHSGDRPYVCSLCSKAFVTKGNMLRHEKTHTGVKPFKCEECKKCFTEKKSLKVHMRCHTGEKPFKCPMCEKCFAQSGILQSHIHLHTGHKGHLCDHCGKAFRQKTQLILHQKRHSNNRNYKCDTCNFSFFTKGDLERHSMKHTGEKPYMCTLCPKSFTRSQYLKEHINIHTGNKPYSCQQCNDVSFYDMSTYHRHMRKHKIEAENAQKLEDIKNTVPHKLEVFYETNDEETVQKSIVENSDETSTIVDNQVPVVVINDAQNESEYLSPGTIIVSTDSGGEVYIDRGDKHEATLEEQDTSQAEIYHISLDPNNLTSEQVQQVIASMDFSAINLLASATTT